MAGLHLAISMNCAVSLQDMNWLYVRIGAPIHVLVHLPNFANGPNNVVDHNF